METKQDNIIAADYSEVMQKSYIDYAMSVIISRALPDVRDGLKPVQRRTLYDMYELGIRYDRPYRKCARIVGDTMGKYHPHGDSSIYEALVVMAQDFKKGKTLVDGHGNFGSIEGEGAAAMRYTEARLEKLTQEVFLADLDKDVVDFLPNFDETEKELKSVEALIADASEYAANLHENKMKTIYNMLTIEKAMLELNYDVNVSENPNGEDGYCVECSAGDECITFDKVSVVDDGRVIITIDHKEATKGTCAASWDEIRKKLAENELFIEDITKNGKSIHGANREVQGHKNESTVKQNLSR